MLVKKRIALAAVLGCVILAGVYIFVRFGQDDSNPGVEPMPQEVQREATSGERSKSPDAVARKHVRANIGREIEVPTIAEQIHFAYRDLQALHGSTWLRSSFLVARHGEADEATEAIIDLVQNRQSASAENSEYLNGVSKWDIVGLERTDYLRRLKVLIPLGITGTDRAEEFLLDIYADPSSATPNRKHRQLFEQQRALGREIPTPIDVDVLTWSYSMTGLVLLDEEKYAPMLQRDFEQLVPLVRRIDSGSARPESTEDFVSSRKFGALLDVLVRRDVIRERGTLTAEYMENFEAQLDDYARFAHRHWTFPDGSDPRRWRMTVN